MPTQQRNRFKSISSMALFASIPVMHYWRGEKDTKNTAVTGKTGRARKMPIEDEFLAVLMRLCLGMFVEDLSERFDISTSHMSKLFNTWISLLSRLLFPWPSQEMVRNSLPTQFDRYLSTRVIIDCTEIFIQRPYSLMKASESYSQYKKHNTFKVLVGISPAGVITFVSRLWLGRASDRYITQHSGILNLLDPGDNVMADRGFDIQDLLVSKKVTLNIPPFLSLRKQLTAQEVESTRRIVAVRIHVERAIGRVKEFHILDGILPISLAHVAEDIFVTCAYLTNFQTPLVSI